MTKNTTLAMPEDNNKNNDIDKQEDNNTPEAKSDMNFLQTVEAMNKALGMTNNLLTDMRGEFVEFRQEQADFRQGQKELTQRVDNLELSYEITYAQEDNITYNVRKLAKKLVGYPSYIYGVTCSDIYRFLRRNYNLASAVGKTEKRYYEGIIKGLNSYEEVQFNEQKLTEHKQKLDEAKMQGAKKWHTEANVKS